MRFFKIFLLAFIVASCGYEEPGPITKIKVELNDNGGNGVANKTFLLMESRTNISLMTEYFTRNTLTTDSLGVIEFQFEQDERNLFILVFKPNVIDEMGCVIPDSLSVNKGWNNDFRMNYECD